MSNDSWFFDMFGFEETPNNVRHKFVLTSCDDGEKFLLSKANKMYFPVGVFSLPSVRDLREKLEQNITAYKLSSSLSSSSSTIFAFSTVCSGDFHEHIVVGDVRHLHAVKAGAIFQAASQFNCLEFPSPSVIPEEGITNYVYDHTQGPACALACAAGTLYRNYFHKVPNKSVEGEYHLGQSVTIQINTLEDVEAFLFRETGGKSYWSMRNGYTFSSREKLEELSVLLENIPPSEIIDRVRIGLHANVGVTDVLDDDARVTQAYCSAMSCAYDGTGNTYWKSIASLVLDGVYEATLLSALLQISIPKEPLLSKDTEVYLTFVGGGVYGNEKRWIANAIGRALFIAKNYVNRYCLKVAIKICHYKNIDLEMKQLIEGAYQRYLVSSPDNSPLISSPGNLFPTVLKALKHTPNTLDQPRIYLSLAQQSECAKYEKLAGLITSLPGWVPARLVADALGYGQAGVDLALQSQGGQPYLWATEFQNAHSTWRFVEPTLDIRGKSYADAESYFYAQKLHPCNKDIWLQKQVDVMREAIKAKFMRSDVARDLLLSTHPHLLLSIEKNRFWGFHPTEGGENMMAKLLMELRTSIL